MRQPKFKNINVTCPHDCPDTCSLVVTVDKSSGKAVKLKGNDKHPITKGFLCNKVNHYLDLCLLYTSPSPRDDISSRMPSSA